MRFPLESSARGPLSLALLLGFILLMSACIEERPRSPTEPEDAPTAGEAHATRGSAGSRPGQAGIEGRIDGLIGMLFPGGELKRRANAAFSDVKSALARRDTATARAEMLAFVDFLLARARAGDLRDPKGSDSGTAREGAVELTRLYFRFVDLDAPEFTAAALEESGAADVVGSDGGTVATGDGKAAIDVPEDGFDEPGLVTVEREEDPQEPGEAPIRPSLGLAPHTPFYDMKATTHPTGGGGVVVEICVPETGPLAPDPDLRDDLRVVRKPGSGEPEVLPGASPGATGCDPDEIPVAGTTTGFSTFGGGSTPAAIEAVAGDFVGPYSCALREDGQVYCWGDNTYGQLGDGTTTDSHSPVAVQQDSVEFEEISAFWTHTCALDSAGSAYCWGRGDDGQLGDGSTSNSPVPVEVTGGHTFTQVTAGDAHTCGLDSDGNAHCWGNNGSGQLGDGTTSDSPTPVAVDQSGGISFAAIRAGSFYTCAVTSADEAYCWGANFYARLGDGNFFGTRTTPTPVSTTLSFVEVAPAIFATCGRRPDEDTYCWGNNFRGLLGNDPSGSGPAFGTEPTPQAVAQGAVTFEEIEAGRQHFCGLTTTTGGEAHCWSFNGFGQLGDGTTTDRHSPTAVDQTVDNGITFTSVGLGGHHSCGTTAAGKVYCWGRNSDGQIGQGTPSDTLPILRPTRVQD